MFDWLKQRVSRWFSRGESIPAPVEKAARGVTLSSAINVGTTGGTQPTWNEWDTRRHLKEWVYAAVHATSQRIAGQPLRVGRKVKASNPSGVKAGQNPAASGAQVRELPDHPLNDLLDMPNCYMTEAQLIALVVSALEISGQAFLWFDEQPGDEPPRLWFIPSGWVREDPEAEERLTKFIVRPESSAEEFRLDSTELIRISYPDPSNPFRPLSPLMACIRSVVCDEEIVNSQVAAFSNGGRPGLLVKIGQPAEDSPLGDSDEPPTLTRAQRQVLRHEIKAATSGAMNSGEPVILDALIKEVTPYTTAPSEMDFPNSSLLTRDRILGIFGVPEVVLGLNDNANRASAVVADETFCYHKCGPIARLISDHLTQFFRVQFQDPDLVCWLEAPKPRDPDGRRADLQQLIGAGAVTLDELRAEHGLQPLPNGAGKALVKAPAGNPQNVPASDPPDRDDRKDTAAGLHRWYPPAGNN